MIHRLLVPGLLEAPPGGAEPGAAPRFPVLERVIARADEEPASGGLEQLLMRLFGLESRQGAAPFCYLADTGREPGTGVLRAHPVHLRADRDQVLLFPLDDSSLTMDEAQGLASRFNAHFSAHGLAMEVVAPHRWYLLTERLPETPFAALDQVAGRGLRSCLPGVDGDGFWLSVLNEIQMLFFDAPVNRNREETGRPPVNGLWLDGGGKLPSQPLSGPGKVRGDHCLLRGLSASTGKDNGEAVTVMTGIAGALRQRNPSAWLQSMLALEAWLKAMIGKEEIVLYSCDGRGWHWKPSCNRRLWRLSRPLPWT